MARYSPDKLEEIRARADLIEVIGAHVQLRRTGRSWVGRCPFHEEKTPSFSVNPERGFYHCFGCGAGGSVFDFAMKLEGLSFPEAVESLARRFGINLPPPQAGAGGAPSGEREQLIQSNQIAAEFYNYVLWKTPEGGVAREYLHSRGIERATAEAFMLGYAPARPANLAATLGKRGLAAAGLRLGLIKQDERGATYDMFRARLMFPIRDAQGRVIAFGGRVLDARQPKYINSPESPLYSKSRAVYGLYEARARIAKSDRAILVEGNVDAIALWQTGFKETVATLGTALTVEQLRLMSRYSRNLIACFDGDLAGRKASLRALEIFLQAGLLGRGAFIPAGFDPDELVREQGPDAFAKIIESAELLVDYYVREQAQAARGSLERQARAAERVAQILKQVSNPYEFDLLAHKAAESLGVSEQLIRQEARVRSRLRARVEKPIPAVSLGTPSAKAKAETGILAISLLCPELREYVMSLPQLNNFRDADQLSAIAFVCASGERCADLLPRLSAILSPAGMEQVVKGVTAFDRDQDDAHAEDDGIIFKRPEFVELNEKMWRRDTGEQRAKLVEEYRQMLDEMARVVAEEARIGLKIANQ